jgi:hypothetical protein
MEGNKCGSCGQDLPVIRAFHKLQSEIDAYESTNLLIEGEQGWPVEFKVGQYPGWQKLAQPAPVLRFPPMRRGRQPMSNKQPAALGLHLLSVVDKLLTLAAPVPGSPLLLSRHSDHGQRD